MLHGLVMFSGGLDSVCATHLLLSQGLSLRALHFVLPFYSGLGNEYRQVRSAAEKLGVPLQIIEEGEEYLPVIKNPRFGFGKNANPCIDCRIHRLGRVKKIMEAEGASFIATGEVVGQRPMSQRRDCLHKIENNAGLKGYILRPLSARLLPPTEAENSGLVDRERLLGIAGRGRAEQLSYARAHGLIHGTPAGGCFLTELVAAARFKDLTAHDPAFSLTDFRLLARGRHFRLSSSCKLVVGRDDPDNIALEKIVPASGTLLYLAHDVPGPVGALRGEADETAVKTAAAIIARYSRFKKEPECRVVVRKNGAEGIMTVTPAREEECERLRI